MTHVLGDVNERKIKMKKDYKKYSETSNEEVQLTIDDIQEVTEEVVEEIIIEGVNEIPEGEEVVEEVVAALEEETQNDSEEHTGETEMEIVEGELNGCTKLNVRAEANKESAVVCVIDKDASFTINLTASTEDFYKIHTCVNEVLYEGFCVKQFISIK